MEENIEELFNNFFDSDSNFKINEYSRLEPKNEELQNEIESLCSHYLINNNGGCNFDNIKKLRNNGYCIYAAEKDSYGWLIGCINKDNKYVYYG